MHAGNINILQENKNTFDLSQRETEIVCQLLSLNKEVFLDHILYENKKVGQN